MTDDSLARVAAQLRFPAGGQALCVDWDAAMQTDPANGLPFLQADFVAQAARDVCLTDDMMGLMLLTPYFIQPRGEPMRTMMDDYGNVVRRLAQRHQAVFVDTQAVFDSAVEHVPVETLAWDRAHLNIPGHMILARAVLQSVGFNWSGT